MEQTIICAKRAGKDLKVYAIARKNSGGLDYKKYLYSIICLDKEEGDSKIITPMTFYRLSTIRRKFRNISTTYSRG